MHNIIQIAEKIEKEIGVVFKDKELLVGAFVHRSFINENKDFPLPHNERLEFLGDAVLELVVTEFLFNKYPDKPEGELTYLRAALVNAESLSSVAFRLNFDKLILVSKGESKRQTEKSKKMIIADAFEAFLGALYLEKGYKAVQVFTKDKLLFKIDNIVAKGLYKDAKSILQEKTQEFLSVTPSYKILKEWGPDHQKNFEAGVYIGDVLIGVGQGASKQEAEINAAKNALENYELFKREKK